MIKAAMFFRQNIRIMNATAFIASVFKCPGNANVPQNLQPFSGLHLCLLSFVGK